MSTRGWLSGVGAAMAVVASSLLLGNEGADAQATPEPAMLDPNLRVRTAASGLELPISLAFLGASDMLVLEKDSGRVKRVVDGVATSTALDLGVNSNSERGLLGIALHPDFPANPGVYLFWTCRSTAMPANPFFPDEERCLDTNIFAGDSA